MSGHSHIHKLLIQRLQRRIKEVETERDRISESFHELSNSSIGKIYSLEKTIHENNSKIKSLESELGQAKERIKTLELENAPTKRLRRKRG